MDTSGDASTWYLRSMAFAVIGLLTSMIVASVGVALINVGVIPVVGRFDIDYEITTFGGIGIFCLVGSAVIFVFTVIIASNHYDRGRRIQEGLPPRLDILSAGPPTDSDQTPIPLGEGETFRTVTPRETEGPTS